jgi:flagella basal body P-ring formation protein FlgA
MTGKKTLILSLIFLFGWGVGWAFAENLKAEDQVKAVIRAFILEKHPDFQTDTIKISFRYADQIFQSLRDSSGKLSFKVLALYPRFDPLGSTVIPLQIYVNGAEDRKIYLNSLIEVYRKVVVVARDIDKHAVFNEADLTYGQLDIASSSREYFLQKEQLLGMQTKTIIKAGKAVFAWMVREIPLIFRGDEVKIKVVRGNVSVVVPGRALGDGYKGKKVKVRALDSRREFVAVVTSTGEVEVY